MLNELLIQYKKITDSIFKEIDDIDKVESFIHERSIIIDEIDKLEYSRDEFKKIVHELNLLEDEEKIIKLIKEERVKTKRAIDNVQRLKKAQDLYHREEGIPVYFNLKSY